MGDREVPGGTIYVDTDALPWLVDVQYLRVPVPAGMAGWPNCTRRSTGLIGTEFDVRFHSSHTVPAFMGSQVPSTACALRHVNDVHSEPHGPYHRVRSSSRLSVVQDRRRAVLGLNARRSRVCSSTLDSVGMPASMSCARPVDLYNVTRENTEGMHRVSVSTTCVRLLAHRHGYQFT